MAFTTLFQTRHEKYNEKATLLYGKPPLFIFSQKNFPASPNQNLLTNRLRFFTSLSYFSKAAGEAAGAGTFGGTTEDGNLGVGAGTAEATGLPVMAGAFDKK